MAGTTGLLHEIFEAQADARPENIAVVFGREEITYAELEDRAEDMPSVRLLILGGEACPELLVERWARPGRRVVNTYGPTEATVITTYAELLPVSRSPSVGPSPVIGLPPGRTARRWRTARGSMRSHS